MVFGPRWFGLEHDRVEVTVERDCRACEAPTVARPGSMDRQSKTRWCGKYHTTTVNVGCSSRAHATLCQQTWQPPEDIRLDPRIQRLHDVWSSSKKTSTSPMCCVCWPQPGGHAGCLCSVESHVCSHRVNLVQWCKHQRNKRERRTKWTYYIHNASLGRYTRVSCNKQYLPLLSLSLSVWDPRFQQWAGSWQMVQSKMWRDRSVKRVSGKKWPKGQAHTLPGRPCYHTLNITNNHFLKKSLNVWHSDTTI